MESFVIDVNGATRRITADPRMPLLWAIRDHFGLTGTKYGCGVGQCGACTVLHAGRAIRSCTTTIAMANGQAYTTIEGLSRNGDHPCQRAWIAEDVAQCGFCQPGMLLEAVALLGANRSPSDAEITRAFSGHVCRCGTYTRIRSAVHRAAEAGR